MLSISTTSLPGSARRGSAGSTRKRLSRLVAALGAVFGWEGSAFV
jgi:hypothetical protein